LPNNLAGVSGKGIRLKHGGKIKRQKDIHHHGPKHKFRTFAILATPLISHWLNDNKFLDNSKIRKQLTEQSYNKKPNVHDKK
jgi:hypothetical protein